MTFRSPTPHSDAQMAPPVTFSYALREQRSDIMNSFRQEMRNEIREVISRLQTGEIEERGGKDTATGQTMHEVIVI